jgi:septal ring factor EnvC (AmiA/AmiB activator)
MKRLTLTLTLTLTATATATKAPEIVEAEQRAALSDVRDLERRARALEAQQGERKERLKKRLRALYKLSSGGLLKLLSSSESAVELSSRWSGVQRVLARDLDELGAVREEQRQLDREHARRSEAHARALSLGADLSQLDGPPAGGLYAHKGKLKRPVAGPIVALFGPVNDADPNGTLAWTRRGVELRAQPHEAVRAVADGTVRWAGEKPGFGLMVAIEHAEGWITLTGRLTALRVTAGQKVAAGAVLGDSAAPTVYLQLAQGTTAVDPTHWLAH